MYCTLITQNPLCLSPGMTTVISFFFLSFKINWLSRWVTCRLCLLSAGLNLGQKTMCDWSAALRLGLICHMSCWVSKAVFLHTHIHSHGSDDLSRDKCDPAAPFPPYFSANVPAFFWSSFSFLSMSFFFDTSWLKNNRLCDLKCDSNICDVLNLILGTIC